MKSFAEFKENINEVQMKMSYREWLTKTGKNHSPENVELYKKTQTEEVELSEKVEHPDSVKHKGQTYWHTGKTGSEFGSNEPSAEYELHDKEGRKTGKRIWRTISGRINQESVELDESPGTLSQHKVIVTVSDPNHPAVSKRKETIMKRVVVKALGRDEARAKAEAYYKKRGYKVHDTQYHSKMPHATMKTESTIDEGMYKVEYKDGRYSKRHMDVNKAINTRADKEVEKVTPVKESSVTTSEYISQHLADKDINSKVEGNIVKVHSSNVAAAKRHLAKIGYKNYKVIGGLNEAYAVTLHHTYPDGKKEDFHYKIKSAKSNKHAARIARLIHVKKNIPTKLISFEPSKDVKLIEHSELEENLIDGSKYGESPHENKENNLDESRGHKILARAMSRMATRNKIASGEIKVGARRDEPPSNNTDPADEKKDKSGVKNVKETYNMLTYSEFVAKLEEGKIDDLKDRLAAAREKRLASYDFSKEKDEKKPGVTVHRSKGYGNGDEDDVESKPEVQSSVKRGRGRPKGSKSGARV